MESFNPPNPPIRTVRVEPIRARPERPIDAVYPWEQTKPVQRAELDALYHELVDIESRIAVLKEMLQLVVGETPSLRAVPILLTRSADGIIFAANEAREARATLLVRAITSIEVAAVGTRARLLKRANKVVEARSIADDWQDRVLCNVAGAIAVQPAKGVTSSIPQTISML
jgi:hypothetical protein